MKKTSLSAAVAGACCLLAVGVANAANGVNDDDIRGYVGAHMNDGKAIFNAMNQYGVSDNDVSRAGGYTFSQVSSYLWTNGGGKAQAPDENIRDYVLAHLTDKKAINDAMNQYTVSDDDVARSTGYSKQQVSDYLSSVRGGTSNGGGGTPVTAVPEPETYAMMALGLGLMGFLGRRRKTSEKGKA